MFFSAPTTTPTNSVSGGTVSSRHVPSRPARRSSPFSQVQHKKGTIGTNSFVKRMEKNKRRRQLAGGAPQLSTAMTPPETCVSFTYMVRTQHRFPRTEKTNDTRSSTHNAAFCCHRTGRTGQGKQSQTARCGPTTHSQSSLLQINRVHDQFPHAATESWSTTTSQKTAVRPAKQEANRRRAGK